MSRNELVVVVRQNRKKTGICVRIDGVVMKRDKTKWSWDGKKDGKRKAERERERERETNASIVVEVENTKHVESDCVSEQCGPCRVRAVIKKKKKKKKKNRYEHRSLSKKRNSRNN
jgi:hypothetical protein